MTIRTRFAPSPSGPLHLGHAYSALFAQDMASAAGGRFLLRIEDIDRDRSRPEWEARIFEDLAWLGLRWPQPVMRQSERMAEYRAALDRLAAMGLTYPCRCRRADIRAALTAPQEGAPGPQGPDGPAYPGTCRGRRMADARPGDAIRLDMARAMQAVAEADFDEIGAAHAGRHRLRRDWMCARAGDVVLARRDFGTSYHLSVVVDDAAQGISHVTRGEDLFTATYLHVLLQNLLELAVPTYCHHKLIRDDSGKRLAKRDDARAIRKYREDGLSPADIRRLVGL